MRHGAHAACVKRHRPCRSPVANLCVLVITIRKQNIVNDVKMYGCTNEVCPVAHAACVKHHHSCPLLVANLWLLLTAQMHEQPALVGVGAYL